jgi:peroxiredoxin
LKNEEFHRPAIAIGSAAPRFDLCATDGERFTLESLSPDQLLVLLLLANHCPLLAAWEDRITALAIEFAGRGAAFVAVSCGDPQEYPEDGFEGMRRRARDRHYPFPYLFDEDHSVARAVGATASPEVLVFDHDRRLRYRGAIAGDVDEKHHSTPYLRDALEGLIAGTAPEIAETQPIGCPIERRATDSGSASTFVTFP